MYRGRGAYEQFTLVYLLYGDCAVNIFFCKLSIPKSYQDCQRS